jgi:polyisoprenoid-binding protein YceI
MDMNSIDVTDIEEGKWKTKFLNHMKSDDFFNVSKYPTATLTIDELKKNTAHGKLTIKDKTHPIKIKFNQRKNTYSGKMSFDRTKYDMIYKSGNYFKDLGDKLIYDEVELEFQVVLKK